MKIWIFSVVAHLLLLWALSLIIIPPAETPSASAVIQTYSYTPIRAKSEPAVIAGQLPVIQNKTAEPVVQAPKKRSSAKTKATESKVASGPAGSNSDPEPTTNAEIVATKPPQSAGSLSLAQRAFASVAAATAEPVAARQQQREVVVRSSTPSDRAPEMLKEVKTYTDGSELVKGAHGCWKVPPPESRKGAIWMTTSTPCDTDTKVEQINEILQKRRTYADN